jgi:hypothetical protein
MIKAISFLLAATFCATTISCRKAENLNELINKGFLYYSKNEPLKPFNGTAYSNKMMRGIEHRMSSYNFKNGVPSGSWEAYGYQNEILQTGAFTPVFKIDEIKNKFPYLNRININRYTEGTKEKLIDIFLISSKPATDSINYKSRKNDLLDYLVEREYLLKSEIPLIAEYVISNGEF